MTPEVQEAVERLRQIERAASEFTSVSPAAMRIIQADIRTVCSALEGLEERIRAVVPHVIATLPKPHDGHPEGPDPDWGCAHMGRSGSSVAQLRGLLDACEGNKRA